ncbi:hypothetical protein GOP47_0011997 [Adiantum capillus-veneris]|uniref:Uncharacterized protein n=1 Tax=Adiantum capillus-veneris TaxID=13818 RepID=A0A9D4UTT7_ADICA|nr:hypothetical protein GOP47_0011997 [Adiantum capillus-veneris]
MQPMASHKSLSKPNWQNRSLDSQEFGFAANSMDPSDVLAPADELFFRGQLLPLQLDHRLHLVQSLSSSSSSSHQQQQMLFNSSSMATARVLGSSSRLPPSSHDLCQEEDHVIEFNSCRLQRDISLHYLKEESMESFTTSEDDHKPLKHLQCLQSSSRGVARDDDKLKRRLSTKTKGFSELDCSTCAGYRSADAGEGEHCILSCCEDDELHSCNRDLDVADCKFATTNDATTDPGSSSFRSQNSGFWDSGTDKDMMDSSSSRDSNGSSQDSYFQTNHTTIKAPSFINASHHHHHHPHSKPMSFNIPWKLALFRRGACKKQANPPQDSLLPFTKVGFSADLSKYKASAAPPLNEVKEALLVPWKLDRELADGYKLENKGEIQRKVCAPSAANDGCSANVMKLREGSDHICSGRNAASVMKSTGRERTLSSSFRLLSKGADVGTTAADREVAAASLEVKKKQRNTAAVKERWQMCARRLKVSCEMKRGWMGQLRMDECGKRAYCEVEHGIIVQSSRAASGNGQMQRRLSHQASSSHSRKGHKPTSQQQKEGNGHSYKVLAMSSCPSSTISSPTHRSGMLNALLDHPNKGISSTHSSKPSSKSLNHPHKDSPPAIIAADKGSIKESSGIINAGSTNYRSISTMQELHSALQSAIAHCKESNKKLNYAA